MRAKLHCLRKPCRGMDQEPDQATDERAVDADELQVTPDVALELFG